MGTVSPAGGTSVAASLNAGPRNPSQVSCQLVLAIGKTVRVPLCITVPTPVMKQDEAFCAAQTSSTSSSGFR